MEQCRQSLPSDLINLLATSIAVNTGYTSRIVVRRRCVNEVDENLFFSLV